MNSFMNGFITLCQRTYIFYAVVKILEAFDRFKKKIVIKKLKTTIFRYFFS